VITTSKYTFVAVRLAVGVVESDGSIESTVDFMRASGRFPRASTDGTHSIVGCINRAFPVVPLSTCTASVIPTSALPYRASVVDDMSIRLYSGLY
jgi:hypothetical protein